MAKRRAWCAQKCLSYPIPQSTHGGTNNVIDIVNRYLNAPYLIDLNNLRGYENQINTAVFASENRINEASIGEKISRKISNFANSRATTERCCTAWDNIQKQNSKPEWRAGALPSQKQNIPSAPSSKL